MNDAEAKDSKIEKWQAKYLYADEIPWIGTSPAMDVMLLRAATARSHAERATEHAQALRPQSTPLSGADLAHAQRVAAAYAAGAFDLGLDAGTPEASCAHVWAPWPASTRPFPQVKCALCRSTMRSWPDMPAAAQPTQGAWTPEPWRSAWDDPPLFAKTIPPLASSRPRWPFRRRQAAAVEQTLQVQVSPSQQPDEPTFSDALLELCGTIDGEIRTWGPRDRLPFFDC